MISYGIKMDGKFYIEMVATLPAWSATDEGRLIYVESEDKLYCGNNTEWNISSGVQMVATLPAWDTVDEGRDIYVEDTNTRYYGGATTWEEYGVPLASLKKAGAI
jgi:hypothetical protein